MMITIAATIWTLTFWPLGHLTDIGETKSYHNSLTSCLSAAEDIHNRTTNLSDGVGLGKVMMTFCHNNTLRIRAMPDGSFKITNAYKGADI
jgi:hypothetical protein